MTQIGRMLTDNYQCKSVKSASSVFFFNIFQFNIKPMFKKIALFCFLILFLPAGLIFSQTQEESKVDSILQDYYSENSPGVSVMVLKDGEVQLSKSYGYANLEDKEKATESTNYHLASLTSQFTAMAVMMLKDEGKANLDQKITEIWDGLPGYCNEVTLDHLLRQSSGLPNLSYRDFYWEMKDIEDIREFLGQQDKLRYQPGERTGTNSLNNALLASYVEKVTGDDYRKFVEKRIFKTLGMESSSLYKGGLFSKISDKARGYMRQNNKEYIPASEFRKDYYEGVTGVFSSLNDLQKWLMAWNTDTLIANSTLNQAKRINFVRGQKQFPGYGWSRAFNKGQKYLYSAGIGNGNTHIILKLPRENIDVVILSNQHPLFGMREKAFELVNLFSEREYEVK
jgi:CubicO group peptidase (beta-lactamase class C family)